MALPSGNHKKRPIGPSLNHAFSLPHLFLQVKCSFYKRVRGLSDLIHRLWSGDNRWGGFVNLDNRSCFSLDRGGLGGAMIPVTMAMGIR